MIGRLSPLIVALVAGIAVASFIPGLSQHLRTAVGFSSGPVAMPAKGQEPASSERKSSADPKDEQQGSVKLSEDEIEAAGIKLAVAQGGTIAHRIVVPG